MTVPPTFVSEFPSNRPTPTLVPPKPDTSSLKEVSVRSSCSEDIKGLSMIVSLEVKGKLMSAVTDTGAHVTSVSFQFYDTLNMSLPLDPVLLKGIDPEKSVEGYLVQGVPLILGGKTYKWDLYVAPIEDQLLLGLDFMVQVDPLISQNVLAVDGQYEISAIFKRNQSQGMTQTETYRVGRVKVSRRVVVPPNTIKLIEGKVDPTFSGSAECMVVPLCAKRGVVLPFATVHLDSNADRTIPMQVVNLSNNFVTFKKDYPLGSIEKNYETLEEDEDSSSRGPIFSEPVPLSPPSPGVNPIPEFDVRMCSKTQSPSLGESPQSSDEDDNVHESSQVPEASDRLLDVQSRIPEHIKDMFLQSCVHLTNEQSIEFGEVLIKFGDFFAKHDNDLGLFTEGEHTIDTGDAKPIKQRMRRTLLCFADEEESYPKKMLDNGVIHPSSSEWASPSVLIHKKDGSVHWTIDFKAVNKVTKKDYYPLSLTEECLDALEGVEFMSTLDKFWVLPICHGSVR